MSFRPQGRNLLLFVSTPQQKKPIDTFLRRYDIGFFEKSRTDSKYYLPSMVIGDDSADDSYLVLEYQSVIIHVNNERLRFVDLVGQQHL